ncbi:DNA cytosine methyltransferase [Burkholderia cepacia]|uniref:DNA cytosine methyltransferase n=1 Tax=Burkholderia cepacia TaxID=292 RepID=UPI00158C2AE2|nr:DNA cytosine methyltransferase [Burkholderia cepacia]
MKENTNGRKTLRVGVVDFFAGCGGASYGFGQAQVVGASLEVIAGIDNDKHCCATYRRMLGKSAHELDIASLVEANSSVLDELIDSWKLARFDRIVLIGCAPCQGFAAHRKAVNAPDHRRSLFGIFAEIAARIRPDAIFMENVPDMFSKKHWAHYQAGRSVLEKAGYHVRSRIYNFADFGLPQERFRAVVMASPKPFDMPEPALEYVNHTTVRDAISHLPALRAGESDQLDPMHIVSKHRPETIALLKKVPLDGGNRPVGVGPACLDKAREKHGGYTDVYGRLAWDRPAVTITARCRTPSCGRFTHPQQHRGLSVREAALLQGFPAEFVFEGPFDDKYKQIGNAVPPMVARQMAEHIVGHLLVKKSAGRKQKINGFELDVSAPVGPGFAVTINGIKRRRVATQPAAGEA